MKVDENLFEELESALIMADAGLEATEALLTAARAREEGTHRGPAKVRPRCASCWPTICGRWSVPSISGAKPLVVMIAGVNGAGKTTSIGKLAHTFQRQGASVLAAAGDTPPRASS